MPVPTKNDVARWAAALTLGQPQPISDAFNTTKFFAKAPLRIHYSAVFNGATATQVHNVSPFNWICCLVPKDLVGITTGAALVALVETHLTDQLKTGGTGGNEMASGNEMAPGGLHAASSAKKFEGMVSSAEQLPLVGDDE
jgi:hypothetical protein